MDRALKLRLAQPLQVEVEFTAPEVPFDKVASAIEDPLPQQDAAAPFSANPTKVETRRWGGRYLELTMAVIVLATVLAIGLHIASHAGTDRPSAPRDTAAVGVSVAPAPKKPGFGDWHRSAARSPIARR